MCRPCWCAYTAGGVCFAESGRGCRDVQGWRCFSTWRARLLGERIGQCSHVPRRAGAAALRRPVDGGRRHGPTAAPSERIEDDQDRAILAWRVELGRLGRMTDTTLEPCPHCGARPPAAHLHSSQPSPHIAGWRVICDVTQGGCGAAGPQRMLKSTAVNAWNRRTPHRLGCACAACRAEIM